MGVSRRSTTAVSSAAVRSTKLPTNCPKRWKGKSGNESAVLNRATTATMDSRNTSLGSCETWTSDSGATSTITSSSEGFLKYTVEPEGRYVETANAKLLPVGGCGKLEIEAKQPG